MSLSIQQKKFVKALHLKKNRTKLGFFIAEGEKIVEELLNSDYEVLGLFATAN